MMSLERVTQDEQDAILIVDAFAGALAKVEMYSPRAVEYAIERILSDRFCGNEDGPKQVIDAFVAYARAQVMGR